MLARLAPLSRAARAAPLARPLSPLARPFPPLARALSTTRANLAETRRHAPPPPVGGVRISHLFLALAGGAILVTTYGILEWYASLRIWPASVREPLRKAIKARNHDETDKAEKYFLEALAAAHALPPADLDPEALQKMSGLYVTFAAMLEPYHPVRAFVALRDALALFGDSNDGGGLRLEPGATSTYTGESMSEKDLTRAIGLAQKMGQIAAKLGSVRNPPPFPTQNIAQLMEVAGEGGEAALLLKSAGAVTGAEAAKAWDEAAETYLSAAIGAMLKMGLAHRRPAEGTEGVKGGQGAEGESAPAGQAVPGGSNEPVIVGRDVRLPHDDDDAGRINRRGLGMTMEALSEVYGRRGRPDLAGQLVLQAITTLLPPQADPGAIVPADRCQAALLMTSLSTYALAPETPQAISAARSWSLRALQEADAATAAAGWVTGPPADMGHAVCQRAGSVALFNLGMLSEMEDGREAKKYFSAALAAARECGFAEGRREAAEALRRVRAKEGGAK
ncbi:hypothetical protein CspeluHIS016_0301350 [Cutaneotrichosporon spelunceum]|uniref:Uncharacterized protein n=1 Tax=Cutaneotrichosporon spelunceum TaxID=1672016 RepID=A0AAD3TSW8_9TREE|nr:hypothetical protein CspeluHIS016_0301350 [Cutaneotrichosporon spelunceum]